MSNTGDELDRLARIRLKHSLKDQGARLGRAEYEDLARFECDKLAAWLFAQYVAEKGPQ